VRETRRIALSVLVERPDVDHWNLLSIALQDPDVVMRMTALRLAVVALDDATFDQLMIVLMRDPFPAIRRDALAHAITHLGDRADVWLWSALFDPNESAREIAHFGVRRMRPDIELPSVYQDLLEKVEAAGIAAMVPIAIAGLGATGGARDLTIVRPYVAHARPSVRRAALRAMRRLDSSDATRDLLVRALEDPSPSVSRTARVLLQRDAAQVGAERLVPLFGGARPAHARVNALLLAARLPKWDVPSLLLSMLGDTDDELARIARRELAGWQQKYNRTFLPPTREQLEQLRAALQHYGGALDRRERAELEAMTNAWGGAR
jgi:HEAT repeat protein